MIHGIHLMMPPGCWNQAPRACTCLTTQGRTSIKGFLDLTIDFWHQNIRVLAIHTVLWAYQLNRFKKWGQVVELVHSLLPPLFTDSWVRKLFHFIGFCLPLFFFLWPWCSDQLSRTSTNFTGYMWPLTSNRYPVTMPTKVRTDGKNRLVSSSPLSLNLRSHSSQPLQLPLGYTLGCILPPSHIYHHFPSSSPQQSAFPLLSATKDLFASHPISIPTN